MQAIRRILLLTVLAVVPAAFAAAAAEPAAPAAKPTAPAAKSPPRAPTLVSVTPDNAGPPQAATSPAAPASNTSTSASAIVDSVRVVGQIQAAPLAQRDTLIREVASRMDAAQRALAALRERVNSPGQPGSNAFVLQRAFMQVRAADQTVRKSLESARASKTTSTWATAQAALTRDYGNYAQAVANVEAAGRGPVVLGP